MKSSRTMLGSWLLFSSYTITLNLKYNAMIQGRTLRISYPLFFLFIIMYSLSSNIIVILYRPLVVCLHLLQWITFLVYRGPYRRHSLLQSRWWEEAQSRICFPRVLFSHGRGERTSEVLTRCSCFREFNLLRWLGRPWRRTWWRNHEKGEFVVFVIVLMH